MSDNIGLAASQSFPCSSTMENIENLLAEMEPNYRRKEEPSEYKYTFGRMTKSVGTQVDIRSWVLESDINKEPSPETYWRKMAEQSKAALEEAKDENKKLHITIDYIAHENIRYQHMIDNRAQENEQEAVVDEVLDYPQLNNAAGAEAASALYFAQRDSDTSCSL